MEDKINTKIVVWLFLVCLPFMLCGCHQPLVGFWEMSHPPQLDPTDPQWKKHPPKVDEIIPPKANTDVSIVIDHVFNKCEYQRSEFNEKPGYKFSRDNLKKLLAEQEAWKVVAKKIDKKINDNTILLSKWYIQPMIVIREDFNEKWAKESEEVYKNIIRSILTQKQQEEYNYRLDEAKKQGVYHGRADEAAKRDIIWSWLFLSDEQKEQIRKMYLKKLADIQKPRLIASELQKYPHHTHDKLLVSLESAIHDINSTIESCNKIKEELDLQDRKARDAQREVIWLESQLKAENDLVKRMELKKQVEDKKLESEKIITLRDRNNQIYDSYQWQTNELIEINKNLEQKYDFLKYLHDMHLQLQKDVLSFDGMHSSKSHFQYLKLQEDLNDIANTLKTGILKE